MAQLNACITAVCGTSMTATGCLHLGKIFAVTVVNSVPLAQRTNCTLQKDLAAPVHLQTQSWKSICHRLAPGGRVMANLGAAPVTEEHDQHAVQTTQAALAAMAEAFDGECTAVRG